ncbi:unnamed protein product (macronuclear) [Paramecium tetraurelia]|uniref:C2 NT-type domain-containing protein n=1 Tax=Paramecium tetraurelia TaxID=5888 RepID=A0E1Z6_PARTE|nr:uncharacterized protein GSPATT00022484001 [Paramecium tetraurelia]CAK89313.1 unnamed protein product [Paramecium tetraurelia]|eukprot:XP_001456710.1 hypothetical protein (macronuclear) [Paramecium tetraurelia strain d4-2]
MNQQIHFKFILQYLEFSSKFDQQQYELSIMLKRGTLAAQTIISKMQIRNPERTSNMCRLPIDQIAEFQQKMVNKDGVYVDYNIKFLFYLGGNQLGDCIINLAYFLNGEIDSDQKVKKPLTSTTDKRAALLFRVMRAPFQSQFETQEYPQANVPMPAPTHTPISQQVPQTARNSSSRKMELQTRTTRARSQSPPKEFKSAVQISKAEEQPSQIKQPSDNLTQKFLQLGEKFSQEKLQQVAPINEDNDNFREITEMLTQQEEELQKQIEQLDNHIKIDSKFRKTNFDNNNNTANFSNANSNNQELQFFKQKYNELDDKYNKAQEENQHLKRIIRQSGEQLKKQNQLSQSGYKQLADSGLNQSTVSNQEQFERTIEKKNQIIKDLSNQLLELEKNSNAAVIEQLRNQITRIEQQTIEKEEQWQLQEKIYKEKIFQLFQNTE